MTKKEVLVQKLNESVKQRNKIFVYVDKLSKQIVGCFYGENDLYVKRFLMTLCFDALEKSHFNIGALAVFIQREVYVLDINDMSYNLFCDMGELVNEACAQLQDQSKVIKINDQVKVVDEKKN